MRAIILLLSLLLSYATISTTMGQSLNDSLEAPKAKPEEWYKKISLRGYTQIRYNRIFQTNPNLGCEQCDRSWGGDGGFFFRRIRLIFFGQIHDRVYIYIQPDFASSASGSNNYVQIRDAYFDLSIDQKKEFRLRFGQSKVPFGFENLQSSQNRIALDRNDALNSAVSNERDIGVFFYWAPKQIRERFSYLVNSGLKGSGDYGVFGLGVYNGQTANRNEANNKAHTVARISYPFKIGKQIIEPGIQGFIGKTVPLTISNGVGVQKDAEYADERVAASFILFPQPFGLSAEYNVGIGPEYNPQNNRIEEKRLHGGYVLGSYLARFNDQLIIPFVRYQYYDGGKKHERDARSYTVKELEIGLEWQPFKNFEVVAMYTNSERRYEDAELRDNLQKGSLLRLQVQFNY